MIGFSSDNIEDIKQLLLIKLKETSKICKKGCENAKDQERYFDVAIVPEILSKEVRIRAHRSEAKKAINESKTYDDLLFYFNATLVHRHGLFPDIFRGKIKKYVLPMLPQEVQGKIHLQEFR